MGRYRVYMRKVKPLEIGQVARTGVFQGVESTAAGGRLIQAHVLEE